MITLCERVSAFLTDEGHANQTEIDDGLKRIRFRTRGLGYTVTVIDDDDAYLQLTCAMQLEPDLTVDAALLRALSACQDLYKCVKLHLDEETPMLVSGVEVFFAGPDGYQPIFWRSVGVIQTALFAGLNEVQKKHAAKAAADRFIARLTNGSES